MPLNRLVLNIHAALDFALYEVIKDLNGPRQTATQLYRSGNGGILFPCKLPLD